MSTEQISTQQTDGVALIARQLDALFGPSAGASEEAARSIREVLERRPASLIAALNQGLRTKELWRRLGISMPTISLEMFERTTAGANRELIGAVLGSCVRDGWVREAAVQRLGQESSVLGLAALLVRLTDTVSSISTAAWKAASPLIAMTNIKAVAASISLVPKFADWERGARWPVREMIASLLSHGEATALWQAAKAREPDDRYAACLLLAEKYADSPRLGEVLQQALRDPNPQLRWWAAQRAANRKATAATVADSLVPILLADPSPSIRLIGLRRLARDVSRHDVALERFVCDPNANVRYFARRFLNRLGECVDSRRQALSVLREPSSSARALTGALGALSESGRPGDRSMIQAFCGSPIRRVAKEAHRTISLL
jgi:hypothetical protein